MNHVAVCDFLAQQVYVNRSFILHKLDQKTFNELNRTRARQMPDGSWVELAPPTSSALNGYCLDAPDYMPAGAMLSSDGGHMPVALGQVCRGIDLAEINRRCELARQMIDEILKEERDE